jgi:hypothetical protein
MPRPRRYDAWTRLSRASNLRISSSISFDSEASDTESLHTALEMASFAEGFDSSVRKLELTADVHASDTPQIPKRWEGGRDKVSLILCATDCATC